MKSNELISVIVPIYNIESYIEKCIESIVNQDYRNIEIILVDDGSTDTSGMICDKYEKIDSRIKVLHKKNGGLSDARNFGMKNANGKYLIFIDGDDYVKENFISRLYHNLCFYKADISVCAFSYIFEDGRVEKYNVKEKDKIRVFNPKQALECMLDSNFSFKQCAWNKLYKKELFQNTQYPFGMLYEDLGTTYKLIVDSKKIVYDSTSLYYYVQRNTSITKTYRYNEKEKNRILMVNEMTEFIDDKFKNIKNRTNYFRATQYLAVINVMFMAGEKDLQFINESKKVIKKNLLNVLKYGNIKQIMQFYIFVLNMNIYRKILLGGKK